MVTNMLNVNNEYGLLKKVLVASVETFRIHPPINKTQEYYYRYDPPKLWKMIDEQRNFFSVLKKNNVEIILAEKREDCTNQINTRDVAFVIGNTFVVSQMKEKERQNEHLALAGLLKTFDSNDNVCYPDRGVIEGGDIVLDNDRIFVGISERTNAYGVEWLKQTFKNKKIIPIYLEKGFLHLDVVFNLIAPDCAIVAAQGIRADSLNSLKAMYELIYAEEKEQLFLPTNVFSINEHTVIVDPRNMSTNQKLERIGKDLIEVEFSENSKIGGSFRCSTCPLIRK